MNRVCLVFAFFLLTCGGEAQSSSSVRPFETQRAFLYPEGFEAGRAFSHGVLAGDTLYVAAQVGSDPMSGEKAENIDAQTRRAMDNIGLVLKAAGMDYGNLVTCHVQLTDMQSYQAMNAAYGSYFEQGRYPARTTLEMPELAGDAEIEISCIGYAKGDEIETVRPEAGLTPPAMGPYSPAVLAGKTLYLSGQGGRNPDTGQVPPSAAGQTAQTIETIGHILEAGGFNFDDVVFTNVYYLGPWHREPVEELYLAPFDRGNTPSNGMFCLSRLPGVISVEITFIAAADKAMVRLFPHDQYPSATPTPATLANGTMYLSAFSAPEAGDLEAQFRAVIEEQQARLDLAQMGLEHVVNANVYLKDIADFRAMDALFREYFPENPPARTTVGVRERGDRQDVLIEMAFIAVR